MCNYVETGVYRGQKRVWILKREFGSSGRVADALNCPASSPPSLLFLCCFCQTFCHSHDKRGNRSLGEKMTEPLESELWDIDLELEALSQVSGQSAGEHPLLSGLFGRTTLLSKVSPFQLGLSQLSCYSTFGEECSISIFPPSFIWFHCSPTMIILKPKP